MSPCVRWQPGRMSISPHRRRQSTRPGWTLPGGACTLSTSPESCRHARGGLLIVSNPNPVTGQVVQADVLQRLAAWAVAADLAVIADESAGPVRPDAPFVRLASLPGMAERTLTIGSFAEAPGLGAWHVSWIAGAKRVFTPVRDLKQSITICTAAASQYAALAAATAVDEGEIEAQFAERMEAILGLLDRHKIAYLEPDTVAFVVAQVADSSAVASACRAAGVWVGDGALLGNPGTVRIAVPSGSLADALASTRRCAERSEGTVSHEPENSTRPDRDA